MTVKTVIKRNGDKVDFDSWKIINAVNKACEAAEESPMGFFVWHQIEEKNLPSELGVEQIQDLVEDILMSFNPKVARKYIRYRYDREQLRMIRPIDLVDKYLDASDWRVKENASVGYSLGGMILNNSGAVTANYWLNKIYPKEIGDAHRDCKFHIHDLSMLSGYCVGHNLLDLIKKGLGGVEGKIASAPPKHLSTLVNQMINYLGCFTEDTKILMSNGKSRSIRELLDSGESEWLVKTFDPNTGKLADAKFDNLHQTRKTNKILELEFEHGMKIRCTEDHLFYTVNRGWVEARDLTDDDDVLSANKKVLFVYRTTNKITGEFYIGSHITFNLNDGYLGSGVQLRASVKQFGRDAFEREILCYAENSEELRELETRYIKNVIGDEKCLNKIWSINRGYDGLNGYSDDTELATDVLYGVCVYKNKKAGYVGFDRVEDLLKKGFQIIDPTYVLHDAKHDYYGDEMPYDTSKLLPGLRNPTCRGGALGKTMPKSHSERMKLWNKETVVERSKAIRDGLNRVGEDGLTASQRGARVRDKNGKSPAQRAAETQKKKGTLAFAKKESNPNYKILDDGFSVPHHSNMKRLEEGTHNFQIVNQMGCHNKALGKRIRQLLEYFNGSSRWRINHDTYLDFLAKYPDWTGKFNFDGFVYSVHKTIEYNKLTVEVSYEALKED